MATVDRIEPAYRAWSPTASGFAVPHDDAHRYVGRHRRPGSRGFSLHRMLYTARHRTR